MPARKVPLGIRDRLDGLQPSAILEYLGVRLGLVEGKHELRVKFAGGRYQHARVDGLSLAAWRKLAPRPAGQISMSRRNASATTCALVFASSKTKSACTADFTVSSLTNSLRPISRFVRPSARNTSTSY